MTLQDKVEAFLNVAEIMSFATEGEDTVMTFTYRKDDFDTFNNDLFYKQMYTYFTGRKVKMVIVTTEEKTSVSFVDTKSGDTINLDSPKFVTGNIDKFFDTVPKNRKMAITMFGFSPDGSTLLFPHWYPLQKPLKIQGYSVTENRSPE